MELCVFVFFFFIDLPFSDLPLVPFFVFAGAKGGTVALGVGAMVGVFTGSAARFVGAVVGIVVVGVEDGCAVGLSVVIDGGEVGLKVVGVKTGLSLVAVGFDVGDDVRGILVVGGLLGILVQPTPSTRASNIVELSCAAEPTIASAT